MKCDIVLAGVGGQGILTIATILGHAAIGEGLFVKQAEVHGMSQRGGDVQANLRISDKEIASDIIPLGNADLIISLEPMEALRYLPYLSKEGWIVSNSNPFINIDNYPSMESVGEIFRNRSNVVFADMDIAAKEVASPRTSNLVLLGAASKFIPIENEKIIEAIRTVFQQKGEAIVEGNIKAFNAGCAIAEKDN